MRTVVLGKIIENVYEVDYKWKDIKDSNGQSKTVYVAKPTIIKNINTKEWKEICSFKGEPKYNTQHNYFMLKLAHAGGNYKELNISDAETVTVYEEIFRADLNEFHLHTSKVIKEIDVNKEEALSVVEAQIKAFNKMMIESNSQLMAYCNLHKLSYEDTDCIELFKLVFPEKEYEIVDGVMKVKEIKYYEIRCVDDYADKAICCDTIKGVVTTDDVISSARLYTCSDITKVASITGEIAIACSKADEISALSSTIDVL